MENTEKIRVIIADDHPAFREGLGRLLKEEESLEVIGQASNGEEAVTITRELHPDVAILDISMPKLNGIEATNKIKELYPDTAVLIVSAFNYRTYLLAALRAGASGYVTKDTPVSELIEAIRAASKGENTFDSNIADELVCSFKAGDGAKNDTLELNPREIEVLKLTAVGMKNKEIARGLKISERTVQYHLSHIFSKLGAHSRTEVLLMAIKQGYLDTTDLYHGRSEEPN